MSVNTKQISAVATINDKDLLFYVKEDGALSFYESASPRESDLKQYNTREIQRDGESIYANQKFGLMAAVAYRDPQTGAEEVRVYYVDPESKLRELKRTNGGEWTAGKNFNDIGGTVAEGSGLSANVAFGQLKVYYQSATQPKGKTSLIYANLGVGNWTPRSRIN